MLIFQGATPLGQGPLSVLLVVSRIWSSALMVQLEDWFWSWVPNSVYSGGGGRSSVEAWYTTALDIEEVLSEDAGSDIIFYLQMLLSHLTLWTEAF